MTLDSINIYYLEIQLHFVFTTSSISLSTWRLFWVPVSFSSAKLAKNCWEKHSLGLLFRSWLTYVKKIGNNSSITVVKAIKININLYVRLSQKLTYRIFGLKWTYYNTEKKCCNNINKTKKSFSIKNTILFETRFLVEHKISKKSTSKEFFSCAFRKLNDRWEISMNLIKLT